MAFLTETAPLAITRCMACQKRVQGTQLCYQCSSALKAKVYGHELIQRAITRNDKKRAFFARYTAEIGYENCDVQGLQEAEHEAGITEADWKQYHELQAEIEAEQGLVF